MGRTHAVRHLEFARRNRLKKLIVLVNDLHDDAVAIGIGDPRQPQPEGHDSVLLDRAQIAQG
jgi:hypothetical protein